MSFQARASSRNKVTTFEVAFVRQFFDLESCNKIAPIVLDWVKCQSTPAHQESKKRTGAAVQRSVPQHCASLDHLPTKLDQLIGQFHTRLCRTHFVLSGRLLFPKSVKLQILLDSSSSGVFTAPVETPVERTNEEL